MELLCTWLIVAKHEFIGIIRFNNNYRFKRHISNLSMNIVDLALTVVMHNLLEYKQWYIVKESCSPFKLSGHEYV